jgi:hypothetical protein
MPKSIGSQSPPAFRILILDEYTEATRQMTRDAEIGVNHEITESHFLRLTPRGKISDLLI